jgi:hypothetical protein
MYIRSNLHCKMYPQPKLPALGTITSGMPYIHTAAMYVHFMCIFMCFADMQPEVAGGASQALPKRRGWGPGRELAIQYKWMRTAPLSSSRQNEFRYMLLTSLGAIIENLASRQTFDKHCHACALCQHLTHQLIPPARSKPRGIICGYASRGRTKLVLDVQIRQNLAGAQ